MGSNDSFHRTLPAKRMGAGAVIRDTDDRVLVVKPTYKDGWELPGGAVEADESPAAACAREVREELGLDLHPGAMLCVDYNPSTDGYLESLMFLFDGGTIDQRTIDSIRLDPTELAEYRFVPLDQAVQMLVPRVGRRLAAVAARPGTAGAYLEDQRPLDGTSAVPFSSQPPA